MECTVYSVQYQIPDTRYSRMRIMCSNGTRFVPIPVPAIRDKRQEAGIYCTAAAWARQKNRPNQLAIRKQAD